MTERAQKIMDAYGKVLEKSVWYHEECVVAVLQHLIDEHSEVRGTGRVDKKSQVVSVKTLMKLIEELKTTRAQKIMDAFYFTFADKRQDFIIQKLDNDALANALRAVVEELRYIGITEKNILELADDLENLK